MSGRQKSEFGFGTTCFRFIRMSIGEKFLKKF